LEKQNIEKTVNILGITDEYIKYGIEAIYYIIKKWCMKNNIYDVVPDIYKNIELENIESLDAKINTNRKDPIKCRFKIIGIGNSKLGNSVVPESWINREFNSGIELHSEMDKLEWRRFK